MIEYNIMYTPDGWYKAILRNEFDKGIDDEVIGKSFEQFLKDFLRRFDFYHDSFKLNFNEETRKIQPPENAKIALEKIVGLHNRLVSNVTVNE